MAALAAGHRERGLRRPRALAADEAVSEVVALARRRPEDLPGATSFVAADVAEDDSVPHLRGADVVVHLGCAFQRRCRRS